jgi:hypothetical protein
VSIVRAPRPKGNFYILDKRISEDGNLSWGARGMLIFLLGKPDNWRVSIQNLVNETTKSKKKSGRDAVYAYLAELREAGYITVYQNRSESGVFGETDYLVHEHSEPLTEIPDTAVSPLPDLPDTALPDAVIPDTVQPNTVNTTLLSIKNQERKTTTTTKAPSDPESSSSPPLLETLEAEFDAADTQQVSRNDLLALKPIICSWVLNHPEHSIQDWLYYYATAARYETARGKAIQRPAAFMQAVMHNPVQDWTPVQVLKETLVRTRTDQQVAQQREKQARAEAEQESQSVTESLALFYELPPDHQQALLGQFRQANPLWSKYELSSKVLQHVLAKWLRQTEWEPPGGEWLHKDRGSPGELLLKQ